MVRGNDTGGFNIGDPVQLVWNLSRLGKVTAFTTPIVTATAASDMGVCMAYIVFPGSCLAQPYDAASLRLCKCATRIPKGVSKC